MGLLITVKDLDGRRLNATVFSYESASFYDVTVKFTGDECQIYFPKGGSVLVVLDDEDIDDPHNISSFDYAKSAFWDIDLVDLD